MAKTRDIVIGVIIGGSFLVFFILMAVALTLGRADTSTSFSGFGSKVAIIDLDGEIVSSSNIVRQLDHWGKNNNVKAIVIHIDSPGGGVTASQEIYEKIMKVREETDKPVVADMSSLAASGGYYVACAADKIVAMPGTITGSIGVRFDWPVIDKLLDKVGIKFETIKSREEKDIGSPYREATEADRAIFKKVVDDTYHQFVTVVSERRGLSVDSTMVLADGSIYTGLQAQKNGLVDSIGTFDDAVDLAGELCGLGRNPDTIKEIPRRRVSLFDLAGKLMNLDLSGILGNSEDFAKPRLRYIFD